METTVRQKVPFHDCDPMGVVWHGNYLKYFEVARGALFDAAGLDLYGVPRDGGHVFPLIRASAKYVRSLKVNDLFDCRAVCTRADAKIVLEFEIRKLEDGLVYTRGSGEQVAIRMPEMVMEVAIPRDVAQALLA